MDSGYIQLEKVLNLRSCDLLYMDTQTVDMGGGGGFCLLLFICYPFQTPLSSVLPHKLKCLHLSRRASVSSDKPNGDVSSESLTFSVDSGAALLSKDVFCLQADIHLEILHNNANACNVTLVLFVRSSVCSGSITSVICASALTKRKSFLFQGGWAQNPNNAMHTHHTIIRVFPFIAKTPCNVFFLTSSNATVADIIFLLSLTGLKETASVFCIIQHCNCKHYAKLYGRGGIQVPTQKVRAVTFSLSL